MQVVDVGDVLLGAEAKFVGRSVDGAAFDAAAGHPHREAIRVVVAAELGLATGVEFDSRRAPELTAEDDKCIVEHTALLEISQECGDGLIDFGGELLVRGCDVVMVVPWLTGPVPELDIAHATLK